MKTMSRMKAMGKMKTMKQVEIGRMIPIRIKRTIPIRIRRMTPLCFLRTLLCLLVGLLLCPVTASLMDADGVASFYTVSLAAAAVEAPANPIDDQGEVWERKAFSTASGMIHIQWREVEEPDGCTEPAGCSESPDSYRIYRADGAVNPFSDEDKVRMSTPWQADLPSQNCFFRYLPDDADEGKTLWFLVRAVKDGEESANLDAEQVVVDLPWIDGRSDPNFVNFYVEDDQRKDSFLQESQKCPFCSQTNKTFYRLAQARLLLKRDYAWYYVECAYDPTLNLESVADCFETEIYPTNFAYFGRANGDLEWTDVDGNGHIAILFTRLGSGINGYFSAEDKVPGYSYENRVGNCSDMLYISSYALSLETVKGTIAHELQHMQHFEFDAENDTDWEELWLDEACSEFAVEINNLYFRGIYSYKGMPNEITLTRFGYYDVHDRFGGCPIHWNTSQQNFDAFRRVIAHYEQVSLFAHYMEYNCSPITPLSSLIEDPNIGLVSVQNHIGLDFRQAFINWTIANYVNPYPDSKPDTDRASSSIDTRYHYKTQFPNGAQLLETQSVIPATTISPVWVKSLVEQEPSQSWVKRSVRDLAADYVLLSHNGSSGDHIHWEIRGINTQDEANAQGEANAQDEVNAQEQGQVTDAYHSSNVCHLAILDHTDPGRVLLHEVMDFSLIGSAGDLSFFEGGADLSSCLVVTNLARYQDSNYTSTYECRAYVTRNPTVLQVRLIQGQREWTLGEPIGESNTETNAEPSGEPSGLSSGEPASAGVQGAGQGDGNTNGDGSPALIKAGWLQVVIRFDQSMSDGWNGLSSCLHLQTAGAGGETIPIQPASYPWSRNLFPADTWTGMIMIPSDQSNQWDGLARISISGGKNYLQETMEKDERFSFVIDTQVPHGGTISLKGTCFISGIAKIEWSPGAEYEPGLAGYRIYGISQNDPVWIPLDSFSDPNHPSYLWSYPEQGIYTLFVTALDEVGNESFPSDSVGLAVGVEIPLDAGQNLVSYPIQPPFADYPCDLWLNELGTSTRSLQRYPDLTYDTAYRSGEKIMGSIFPIVQDAGYIIYRQEPGHLTWSGPVQNLPISLHTGRNIVGIPLLCGSESILDFFRDLVKKGEPVSNIRFYQSRDGKWENSYSFFGQISGHDTIIRKGMGCMVELKEQ